MAVRSSRKIAGVHVDIQNLTNNEVKDGSVVTNIFRFSFFNKSVDVLETLSQRKGKVNRYFTLDGIKFKTEISLVKYLINR